MIECAAVEGQVFHEDAVSELIPESQQQIVESALDSLLLKELIKRERLSFGARTFRFRHLLIRDAAYESIPKEFRADLHERFGRWLESTAGERATEYEEVVGYHLEQAHRYSSSWSPTSTPRQLRERQQSGLPGPPSARSFAATDPLESS